ncbi:MULTISPECIES: hypothetical protein [unclassified Streptomyces]|nr:MULTISPECIES: hypothetical protein [unclassified Streptomyces]
MTGAPRLGGEDERYYAAEIVLEVLPADAGVFRPLDQRGTVS